MTTLFTLSFTQGPLPRHNWPPNLNMYRYYSSPPPYTVDTLHCGYYIYRASQRPRHISMFLSFPMYFCSISLPSVSAVGLSIRMCVSFFLFLGFWIRKGAEEIPRCLYGLMGQMVLCGQLGGRHTLFSIFLGWLFLCDCSCSPLSPRLHGRYGGCFPAVFLTFGRPWQGMYVRSRRKYHHRLHSHSGL